MIVSKIDGTILKNQSALAVHLHKYSMSILEYYIKYEGFVAPKCKYCDKEAKRKYGIQYRVTCGSNRCIQLVSSNRVMPDATKEKIRKARFKYLSDSSNFDKTAWGKVAKGRMTYGEEKIHSLLTSSGIYERFDVIYQYPVYPYFIDFAFVNEKVALEFDGKCHFKYNERIEHDVKRDIELCKLGWRVYRVSYLEIDDFKVEDLLKFIGSPKEKQELSRCLIIRSKKTKCPPTKRYENKQKYENDQFALSKLVEASDIDFTKTGWVGKVSMIIGRTPQKVNQWMKRFMPDFYESRCKKRKT